MECFTDIETAETRHLISIVKDRYDTWFETQTDSVKAWLNGIGFQPKPGAVSSLPNAAGYPDRALLILETSHDLWSWGGAASKLPEGVYKLTPEPDQPESAYYACLGWALGNYVFDRYKTRETHPRKLFWPDHANKQHILAVAQGIYLTRDLINTPAADMGPEELGNAACALARDFGGHVTTIVGQDLLQEKYPMIHAVGRAASRPPGLIDLNWGEPSHPRITLVGKGVCFDTGGLDIKPSSGMLTMKKDMGGAAHALGLAHMIMASQLPIALRVLIPAVENSVSGDSFRPLDILTSRKGLTVEVGNTDAEGRLILADALAAACEDPPDLLIDFATLTGAHRVALGTDIPGLFCNCEHLAEDLMNSSLKTHDPIWRLPLHKPYRDMLKSKLADLNNIPSSGLGGAITAALFLEEFVARGVDWAHFDMMAWNPGARPGRPEGGEAQAIRCVFDSIRSRFG